MKLDSTSSTKLHQASSSAQSLQAPAHAKSSEQPAKTPSYHSETQSKQAVVNQHVVQHSRPFTLNEQQTLLSMLPKSLAAELAQRLSSSGSGSASGSDSDSSEHPVRLHLVQTLGPNGHKNFTTLQRYTKGERINLTQAPLPAQTSRTISDTQGRIEAANIEQWRPHSPSSSPAQGTKLDNLLRQYQPIISKLTDILVRDVTTALHNAPSNTSLPPAIPTNQKVDPSALIYPLKETKDIKLASSVLVLVKRSSNETQVATSVSAKPLNHGANYEHQQHAAQMKLPPSSGGQQPPEPPSKSLDQSGTSQVRAERATVSLAQLSQAQITQLKDQWVEVAQIKSLDAKQSASLLQTLPQPVQNQLNQANIYQVHLKTPVGELTVLSPTPYKTGELIKLDIAPEANNQALLKIVATRQAIPDSMNPVLANALRQYQPLKNAMQALAMQHIEAGRMQALAANTKHQLGALSFSQSPPNHSNSNQPSPPLAGVTASPMAATKIKLEQLKQTAQQLLMQSDKATAPSSQPQENRSATSTSPSPIADIKLPTSLLDSKQPIQAKDIHRALQQAGQELEANLKKLTELPEQNLKQNSNARLNVQRGFSEINQNIQAGIKEWIKDITGKSKPHEQTGNASTQASSDKQAAANASAHTNNQTVKSLTDLISNDMKTWLMKNQVQLMQVIQNDPNGRADQRQLMDGLLKVLFPKQAGFSNLAKSNDGEAIIPKNLSVQPHLQRLFSQLLGQQPQSEASDDSQQLRQLLNLTQNLTRIQQDQVMNRNQQVQQPDSPDFQLSLPYLHEKSIQWCEIECQQTQSQAEAENPKRGWHIILRFAQEHPHAFAVEANLVGNQLVLSLWSEQQARLKQLNRYAELLKEKVKKAGFVCESIHSKHGMPVKKQRQIQQGLVDVRT